MEGFRAGRDDKSIARGDCFAGSYLGLCYNKSKGLFGIELGQYRD